MTNKTLNEITIKHRNRVVVLREAQKGSRAEIYLKKEYDNYTMRLDPLPNYVGYIFVRDGSFKNFRDIESITTDVLLAHAGCPESCIELEYEKQNTTEQ